MQREDVHDDGPATLAVRENMVIVAGAIDANTVRDVVGMLWLDDLTQVNLSQATVITAEAMAQLRRHERLGALIEIVSASAPVREELQASAVAHLLRG